MIRIAFISTDDLPLCIQLLIAMETVCALRPRVNGTRKAIWRSEKKIFSFGS